MKSVTTVSMGASYILVPQPVDEVAAAIADARHEKFVRFMQVNGLPALIDPCAVIAIYGKAWHDTPKPPAVMRIDGLATEIGRGVAAALRANDRRLEAA